MKLLPRSPFFHLRLGFDGLRISRPFHDRHYTWSELSSFSVLEGGQVWRPRFVVGAFWTYQLDAAESGQNEPDVALRIDVGPYGGGHVEDDAAALAAWLTELRERAALGQLDEHDEVSVPAAFRDSAIKRHGGKVLRLRHRIRGADRPSTGRRRSSATSALPRIARAYRPRPGRTPSRLRTSPRCRPRCRTRRRPASPCRARSRRRRPARRRAALPTQVPRANGSPTQSCQSYANNSASGKNRATSRATAPGRAGSNLAARPKPAIKVAPSAASRSENIHSMPALALSPPPVASTPTGAPRTLAQILTEAPRCPIDKAMV